MPRPVSENRLKFTERLGSIGSGFQLQLPLAFHDVGPFDIGPFDLSVISFRHPGEYVNLKGVKKRLPAPQNSVTKPNAAHAWGRARYRSRVGSFPGRRP